MSNETKESKTGDLPVASLFTKKSMEVYKDWYLRKVKTLDELWKTIKSGFDGWRVEDQRTVFGIVYKEFDTCEIHSVEDTEMFELCRDGADKVFMNYIDTARKYILFVILQACKYDSLDKGFAAFIDCHVGVLKRRTSTLSDDCPYYTESYTLREYSRQLLHILAANCISEGSSGDRVVYRYVAANDGFIFVFMCKDNRETGSYGFSLDYKKLIKLNTEKDPDLMQE
jgi:hypothetical protein